MDDNNKNSQKIRLGALLLLLLLLVGACSILSGLRTKKNDNSINVADNQDNIPSELYYSSSEQYDSFIGADEGEGEITYELIRALDERGIYVYYFSLLNDKSTQIVIAPNTPAGTYELLIRAKASGDESHISGTKEFTVKITINKADGSFDELPAPLEGLVYTGSFMDLVDPGTSSTGTIYYKVDDGDWTTTPPQAKDVGTYTVYYKLVGDNNHNDIAEQSFTVTIGRASVGNKPASLTVTYNGQKQSIDYKEPANVTKQGDASGITPGVYKAVYTPKDNYCWSDGTVSSVTATLTIEAVVIEKPTVLDVSKPYNGKEQTNGYEKSEFVDMVGKDRGTEVGVYKAVYTPKQGFTWSDGTTDSVIVTLTIENTPIDKPVNTEVNKVYNGQIQTNGYEKPEFVTMVGADSGTDADTYKAIYTPKENYCWSDGTRDPVTVTLTIKPAPINKPAVLKLDKPYNGKNQNNGYGMPDGVIVDGPYCGIDVGTYEAVYMPDANHIWSGSEDNRDPVKVILTITKAQISVPTIIGKSSFRYDGKKHSVSLSHYNQYLIIVSGDVGSMIDAGEYEITFELKDTKNSEWKDGTVEAKTLKWNIRPAKLNTPKVKTVFEYNPDNPVTYKVTEKDFDRNYDRNLMNIVDSDEGILPGQYNVTVKLTNTKNYCWSDGTTGNKVVEWEIKKARNPITLPEQKPICVNYNPNQQTRQFRAPENAAGAVTYEFKYARTKVTHSSVDYFDIADKDTNAIVIKPETPVGIYEVVIAVHAAGNDIYNEFTGVIKINVTVSGLHYVIKFDGNGADRGLVVDQNIYGTYIGDYLHYNQYVRDAYEFTGWNTEKDGSGEGNFSDVQYVTYLDLSPYEHDGVVTLYAQWAPKTIKVFYNLKGGSFKQKDIDDGKVVYEYTVDSEPFTLCSPAKPHYRFTGWSGTGISEIADTVTVDPSKAKSNRVFNAHWEGAQTAILFIKMPNSLADINILDAFNMITYISAEEGPIYGEKYGDIFPKIGKEGYYGGWYTLLGKEVTAESTVSTYLDKQTYENVMSLIEGFIPEEYKSYISIVDLMFTAFGIDLDNTVILIGRETPYTNISYTVNHYAQRLDLNSYDPIKTETRFGSTDARINGEDIALTVTGFTYTSQNGDETIKADGSSTVNLYYDRDLYEIEFDSRGGSDVEPQLVPYDGLVSEPENPRFLDKKFSGWYYNGKLFDFGTRIRGKITLYARWDVEGSVNVIAKPLDPETGGVSGTGTYELGDEVVLTPYANEDYCFTGWSDGVTDNPRIFTVSEEDIEAGRLEFVAIFEKISSRSLVNYDQITYTAKPGDIIDVTDVFKSILLIERYSSETEENSPLSFDIDRSVLVSRNKAYVTVGEDAKDGTYSIDVTVRPFLIDLRHDRSTVRIYVKVDTDKHAVSFNSNGGTLVTTQYVPDGETATIPEKPYREGYDFNGWYYDGELFDFDTPITEDITLEAAWLVEGIKEFTITVTSNNDDYGTVSGSGKYEKGETAVIKAVPKLGYRFVCWNNDEQLTSSTISITVEEDAEYVAVFAEFTDDYFRYNELNYALHNGQEYDTTSEAFVNLANGSDYTVEYIGNNNRNLVEFEFRQQGWGSNRKYHGRIVVHDGAIPGETYSLKVVSKNNPESYIVFNVEIECTVNFVYSSILDSWDINSTIRSILKALIPTGHEYVKYNTAVGQPSLSIIDSINENRYAKQYNIHIDKDQITWYQNGVLYDFDDPVTSNITLNLGWRGKFEVTFDLGEGEIYKQEEVIKGELLSEPAKPKKQGKIFQYWMVNGAPYDFTKPVESNLYLEAAWIDGVTVTFDYNYDSRVVYETVDDGDTVAEPKDTVLSGSRFVGWYQLNEETGELSDVPFDFNTKIREDITLVAKWMQKEYQVVYDTNGGTPVSTRNNVKWNDNDLTPDRDPHPILPIYVFSGWYINEDCTVPYRNQTYAEVANYNDDTEYVVLYAGWYNRSIVHYTDKFSSVAGEEAEYIIRSEDDHYLLFREYEILEASESGMFRMNKDNNGVVISSAAEPGTYYIKVSSVINTPLDYFVDIDILDHIQTIMIEWTVEPAPEPEENDDADGDTDGVQFGMSTLSTEGDLDPDSDSDILSPTNENLNDDSEQPQADGGVTADPVNNEGNNSGGEGGEGDNDNSRSAGDLSIDEMIPPIVQEVVVENEQKDNKEDEDPSNDDDENGGGAEGGGDGGPEAGEDGAPAAGENSGSSGSDIEG